MDNDGDAVNRDTARDVHPESQGTAERIARAVGGDRAIARIEIGELVDTLRGALVPMPSPVTVPERVQSLERRTRELEMVAGICFGVLILMFLLRR